MAEPKGPGGPRPEVTLTPVDFDPFAEPKETVGLPLTDEQAEVWSAAQMGQSASCSFNQTFTVLLRGELSASALEKALQRLVERHEGLRARFDAYGEGQTIAGDLKPSLPRKDLSSLSAEERASEVSGVLLREAEEPFDLENGPLFRAQLLRTGVDEHKLVFTAHHLVCDGWSSGILLRDLGALYSAEGKGVRAVLPPAASYRDYLRQMASPEEKARQRAAEDYWAGRFADAVPVVELPLDRARPTVMSYRGRQENASLSAEFQGELRKLGARHGCTLYVTLLAAFQVLVSRLAGQRDVVVGIPLAGQAQIENGNLVGHCVHTLPLRARVDHEQPFPEHLKAVRGLLLAAHENHSTTFGNLVRRLALARDPSRTPLVAIVFNVDKLGATPEFAGLGVEVGYPDKSFVNFDINLNLMESSAGLTLECSYNADLFDRSTVRRWLGHYRVLLESLVAGGACATTEVPVGRVPILEEEERRGLVRAPERQYEAGECLHERFERRVAASPEAVAVVCEGASLTYAELNRRANRLAHRLRARGVGPESLVGLSLERSLDLVVGILGILKAGGAYLPLDPDYPKDRLAFMVEDAGVRVVVARRGDEWAAAAGPEVLLVDDDEPASEDNPASGATASSLAYVIYTSGSTGRPKGCQVTHGNVTRLFEATDHWFGFDERDVWTLFHSCAFDFTVWELWGALLYGGRLVVVPYWVSRSPDAFFELLRREQVTVLNQTPSAFRQLIQADLAAGAKPAELALRYVIFGGEALNLQSLRPWMDRRGDDRPRLVNMYGITETTVHVTYRRIERKDVEAELGSVIGVPIPDLCVHVLDGEGQPVPIGVPGEMHVGGAGVARGYLNRPELTGERFVRDPFSGDPEARLYRSGDLARRLENGDLEYLGRIDQQVKIRGFRIELGEIEAALSQHPGVRENVVIPRDEAAGDRRLIAYVVAEGDRGELTEALRSRLRQGLPEYMVPSAFVFLDALPLNQNGKVDQRALPAPGRDREGARARFAAPRSESERGLAAIWSAVLGVERIGIDDDFFDLGGHSLLAAQVVSRAKRAFAVDLSLRELFLAPTVARLSERVEELRRASRRMEAELPLVAEASRGPALPSFSQERLWLVDQVEEGGAAYVVAEAMRMRGALAVGALEQALGAIVARHEPLRTTFGMVEGQAMQIVGEPGPWRLPLVDLAHDPERLDTLMAEEAARGFDLGRGPLFRALLYRLAPEHHVLLLLLHHTVADAWSLGVLARELGALYRDFRVGVSPALPALPVQYRDYARWQREWLQGQALARQLEYWRGQLAGAPEVLELPSDRPRPPVETHRGALFDFTLSRDVAGGLGELARREGATLFMTLLAAFDVLLWRYTGQQDLLLGTPVANRGRAELDGLIGLFVNTLVLRADLSGDPTVAELLRRVKETCLGAYAHQDLPFEKLVEELRPARDLSRNPLFQVMLVHLNAPRPPVTIPDLEVAPVDVDLRASQVDLTLYVAETPEGLRGTFEYATDLFDEETIARLTRHLRALLEGFGEDAERRISELPLLTDGDWAACRAWNSTAAEYPEACVHELISAQAGRTPERVALDFAGRTLRYGDLEKAAERLAQRLREQGVVPGARVGVFMRRSPEMVVGLLGVLKAGGAYVPLDPDFPAERLSFMLEDSGAAVLLTDGAREDELPSRALPVVRVREGEAADASRVPGPTAGSTPVPDDLAYVIYTSGSTGRPKGVAVTHRALVNLLVSMGREPGLGESDVLLSVTTLSFDIAALELYLPLLKGARIALASREDALDGKRLIDLLTSSRATVMQATPATWRLMIEAGWQGTAGLKVLCGGEALPRPLADELLRRSSEVWNLYGPTETTVWSSVSRVEAGEGSVSIGRPIANTQMWILDGRRQPVPVGVPGELYIGGMGLARGYWNRPDLTAECFVTDSFSERQGARLYRTGDVARSRGNGRLECLGRIDHQVKVRGFRIELGEIEASLTEHPSVRNAVVIVREDDGVGRRLVAYVVGEIEPERSASLLQEHLRKRVPYYMVPSEFVVLEALPLTPNGKIDRKALPSPPPPGPNVVAPPRNPSEEAVAAVWRQVLARTEVGIHDNFFDLGGHSLLAAQVVSRVRRSLGVELSLREIFLAPTIARLTERIEELRGAPGRMDGELPLQAEASRGPALPSFSQERLWLVDQVEEGGAAYVVAEALGMRGPLVVGALEQALGAIVARHEPLRTTFGLVEGQAMQIVAEPGSWPLPLVDLGHDPERLDALMAEEAARGFDLGRGPLFRALLYRLAPEHHVLLLLLHHTVADAWSLGVLVREMGVLYQGFRSGVAPAVLPALPVQYRDYARWQREWLQGPALVRQVEYWRTQLGGAPQVLELPTDRPRPPVETHNGAVYNFTFPPEVVAGLAAVARREGATLFMTLLAAFDVLLWRYTGQQDLLVGTPVANRGRAELDGLIGLFVNTLVLRADLSGDPTVAELLRRVQKTCLEAYAHQDLPFEKQVEELRPARDLSRNPLYQVMLVHLNAPRPPLAIPDLEVAEVDVDRKASQVDLTLYVAETPEGLRGTFEYATDLFDEETIARLTRHLRALLVGFGEDAESRISELPLLAEEERHQLLVGWNATEAPLSGELQLHRLFEEQVGRTPEAIAVVRGSTRLSYAELNMRANRLARYLRDREVDSETRVAVCLERTVDLLVAILGVLKAGGAYVPLDPAYPPNRSQFMIQDAGARLLLTQESLRDRVEGMGVPLVCLDGDPGAFSAEDGTNLDGGGGPGSLAYVIYTSGSTGKPKGVAIEHRSAAALVCWAGSVYSARELSGVLASTSVCFDLSVFEMFVPLSRGGTVVVAEDLLELPRLAARGDVTLVNTVPSVMTGLLQSSSLPSSVITVNLAGEPLSTRLVDRLYEHPRLEKVYDLYGPSETTTYSTFTLRKAGEPATIGRPIANTQAYVLDARREPVPIGVVGELFLGGQGLARGYLGRPELTAERFVQSPFSTGERLYATGDLARWRADGRLEYVGRVDQQVKLRGFRIELGEVASCIAGHASVKDVAVVVRQDDEVERRLVGYVVSDAEHESLVDELRVRMRATLPEYMVPSAIVFLDALPLGPNGKVDKKALPAPGRDRQGTRAAFVAPRNEAERTMAEIWTEVLGIESVGIHDNFFDLGGHSMLAVRLLSQFHDVMGVDVPLRTLFQQPTVAGLAGVIQALKWVHESGQAAATGKREEIEL